MPNNYTLLHYTPLSTLLYLLISIIDYRLYDSIVSI